MVTIIRKLNPFSSCEIEYLESWLCDMAKEGLFIDSIILCFASFQKGAPKNRRYRILPKVGDIKEEEIEFYSQQQWVFAFSFSGLNIFYTDNEETEELFTDAASFRSYTKKYALQTILAIIAFPFLCYWWITLILNASGPDVQPLHFIDDTGLLFSGSLGLLLLLAVFYAIRVIIDSVSLIIKIKRNLQLNHNKPYKRMVKFYKTMTVLTLVAVISFPVGVVVSHNAPYTSISYEDTVAYQGAHPVMFKELDRKHWALVQKSLDTNYWTGNIDYSVDNYWNGLFNHVVYVDVRINEGEPDGIVYVATYYNARFPWIAQRFLEEDISYSIGKKINMDDIHIDSNDVDYAGYYVAPKDSTQYLFVLNGSQLETVTYLGEKNLKDNLHLYIDDVNHR